MGSRAHGLVVAARHMGLVALKGIEPASPALEGGFLTTRPPGKSPQRLSYAMLILLVLANQRELRQVTGRGVGVGGRPLLIQMWPALQSEIWGSNPSSRLPSILRCLHLG